MPSVFTYLLELNQASRVDMVWWSESCPGCVSPSLHLWSQIFVMENFPEHAERKTFSGTSRLFSCIILIGTRSNDTGFLFWVSKPWHYVRSILCMCGCIYQISRLCSLRRHLSLCWAVPCCTEIAGACNRLLLCLSSWEKDQPGKYCLVLGMCELVFCCPATLFPYST